MADMKDFVPAFDEEKMRFVLAVREAYDNGELTLAEAQAKLKEKVSSLAPYEVALAEQKIKAFDQDECKKEDIQSMLLLFDDLMSTQRPDLPEDHPLAHYYAENDALRKILLAIEDLVQYPVIKNQWYALYDDLKPYKTHFDRKQNQLYAALEKKGFDRPTTTMWTLDDMVWGEIKSARKLLDDGREDDFINMQATIVADVRDLMEKEEIVLYPTALAMLTSEEFAHMAQGDEEIGFAWIEVGKAAPVETTSAAEDDVLGQELAALFARHGYGHQADAPLAVATGELTLAQINLIYKHLPVDLAYVDENELVRFYSDTDHRVFPRSRNVIGRNVKNCHPRDSVHTVTEIIEKFRSGEEDQAEFWIEKPGLFIYIYYVAVRDENGVFRGVLEMMQDCTHIRSLSGSRTLLSWDTENSPASEEETETTAETEQTKAPVLDESLASDVVKDGEGLAKATTAPVINPDTGLQELLQYYPWLKNAMADIHPAFKKLQTPLARVMIPKATVNMMAERSGMDVGTLITCLEEVIAKHEQ